MKAAGFPEGNHQPFFAYGAGADSVGGQDVHRLGRLDLSEGLEGKVLGNYHILQAIGQGGMTTVYKALDIVRNETVAIKALSPYIAQDPRFRSRFEREVELLLELKHPNIVPILDYGDESGYGYIVMPFMPLGTLHDRLATGNITPQEGAQIIDDIAQALDFAHQHGIVHRDVKPSNILLTEDGHALLSDFGFAHIQDLSANLTGSALIGTPAYMSPEQCKGGPLTVRSDQYSLGIVLYQLCSGQLPFGGDTPMAVAVKHINDPLPRPRKVNPNIPAEVERVLIQALAKRPEDRYESVADLNDAFQAAVAASLDEAGNFIPQPDRFDISTWIMEDSPFSGPMGLARQIWSSRYRGTALAVLVLLLLPSVGLATAAIRADSAGQLTLSAADATRQADYQATIQALYTAVAGSMGSQMSADQISAAVEATMQAMQPQATEATLKLALPAGSNQPTATPTATPAGTLAGGSDLGGGSPTPGSGGGSGDGGGNSQGGPTATRTITPSRTPTPGPTEPGGTPAPSNTPAPQPTNTSAPQPTNTSAPPPNTPIPTDSSPGNSGCKNNPSQPHPTCTPESG
jgi:serine/threonine protein kinase